MYLKFFNASIGLYILAGVFYVGGAVFNKSSSGRIAAILQALGLIGNGLAIAARWFEAGRPPLSNLHESLVFFSFVVALAGILAGYFYRLRFMAGFAAFFCLLLLGYASLLDRSIRPLMPALKSNWLIIHVTSYFVGYAACFIAFAAAGLYLINVNRKAQSSRDFAARMIGLNRSLVLFAFPFLTLGISAGAVWANIAWGRYWGWDPKETWALITWLIYALYLHLCAAETYPKKICALISIVGFLAILFTFFGVSLLLRGLHSYA